MFNTYIVRCGTCKGCRELYRTHSLKKAKSKVKHFEKEGYLLVNILVKELVGNEYIYKER